MEKLTPFDEILR